MIFIFRNIQKQSVSGIVLSIASKVLLVFKAA
jgi:hypothetical protein